jgi:aspartate-semialdehyde dehydrogenase
MQQVALIGMRGLVGSVLMQRMHEEGDFKNFEPHFFSTSQAGKPTQLLGFEHHRYQDAYDLQALKNYPIILSCQGGAYTEKIFAPLRKLWNGYFIDAASTLRMQEDAMIIFDPINGTALKEGIHKGIKNFVGSNCTVSLLLFALNGLIKEDLIEWLTVMTYQAASGAGAEVMRELLLQMYAMTAPLIHDLQIPEKNMLTLERAATAIQISKNLPTKATLKPLAGNLLPWIDSDLGTGVSREEAKMQAEAQKILNKKNINMDGLCVRVGTLRCHSQAITMKLKRALKIETLIEILRADNSWIKVVENTKDATLNELTPMAITGTLTIAIGRLRKLNVSDEIWSAFTIGDQLLWGAAEPLRRFLKILLNEKRK